MNYTLLKTLIDTLFEYEQANPTETAQNMPDFLEWASQKHPKTSPNLKQSAPVQGSNPAQITQFLFLMHKYLRFYLRKLFEGTPLVAADDFGFLATLAMHGDMPKHELIRLNTIETSSGMEIIKRLEKAGLIYAYSDLSDKRAKKVGLTGYGRGFFFQILPEIAKVGDLALGDLNPEESEQLLQILQRLDNFHNPIFHTEKNSDLAQIFAKWG